MINFSDTQTRYLIDYANLKQGLIRHQNDFLSKQKFEDFVKKKYLGFPLVLPLGIKYFNYSNCKEIFKVSRKRVKKLIFGCKKNNYIGMKIFFKYGNRFCIGAVLKKRYQKDVNLIIKKNSKLISLVKRYKQKNKVSSFQTRNIPHLGHELIIQRLMGKKKILFINSLIGMKKKGDCKNDVLKNIYKYLLKLKLYRSKVVYGPVICNMNYAGPREAIHHSYIRENLGFNRFSIGRDHAGAEDNYGPLEAIRFVKKNEKRLKINIFFHNGAYFCKRCKKIVLKGDCNHRNLDDISGSEFRDKLNKKKTFLYARFNLQKHIKKFRKNLFY